MGEGERHLSVGEQKGTRASGGGGGTQERAVRESPRSNLLEEEEVEGRGTCLPDSEKAAREEEEGRSKGRGQG